VRDPTPPPRIVYVDIKVPREPTPPPRIIYKDSKF
jgi:hypothetical protein